MNYPVFKFSKHLHFPKGVMVLVKFVPLMAQVAKTHMDTRKSLQRTLRTTFLKMFEIC